MLSRPVGRPRGTFGAHGPLLHRVAREESHGEGHVIVEALGITTIQIVDYVLWLRSQHQRQQLQPHLSQNGAGSLPVSTGCACSILNATGTTHTLTSAYQPQHLSAKALASSKL